MRKGDAMAEKIKLPDGQELPIFPLGESRIETLALIAALSRKVAFYGDGDFANGHALLKKRKEQIKESLAELEDAEEG